MTERPTQPELLREASVIDKSGPVTRLGMTFTNEDERRAYFTAQLREYLQDPAFRAIEGFPLGADDDILALSDPPYYTACPNPFLPQIMAEWQAERAALHAKLGLNDESYHREPFAADVSEGKNDPIYNAHSYHTKVPHKAIMRYILHYTEPGDIVFDGFCGTGMTGVAAQLCGDRKTVESLGYQVAADGTIYDNGKALARLGARKAVLNDLSPAATFIAYNYNTPVDVAAFEREAKRILQEVEDECGWMYKTSHVDGKTRCSLNFCVWSDVFICTECSNEIIFWNDGVDKRAGNVKESFTCRHCGTVLNKRDIERSLVTRYDSATNDTIQSIKQVPVLINYSIGNKRYEKTPDQADLEQLERIDNLKIPYWFPSDPMMLKGERWGDTWRAGIHLGITHTHHFYSKRNLFVLAAIWQRIRAINASPLTYFLFTSTLPWTTRQNRLLMTNYFFKKGGVIAPNLPGTLYISSVGVETNPIERFRLRMSSARFTANRSGFNISTQSATKIPVSKENSVDYMFVDPPFGDNLMYSELNFVTESWLRIITNTGNEAIINKSQAKGLLQYLELMEKSFREFYRILKPGKWITVEFHNSQSAVWNSIQEALLRSGFVIADVRFLEKLHKTFKQVTATNAVKKDLVITAYKPTIAFEQQFLSHAGTTAGVWDFVRQHLAQVPPIVINNNVLETVAERQNYLLFDRMVAYHIQRGVAVPMGAAQFYAGLVQYFAEADGMYFLPDQIAQYNKTRSEVGVVAQLSLFVNDEKSAITWLRQQLQAEPQSFQQIQPRFLQELHQARHEDLPDLRVLLEQNFLQDDEGHWYVPDPDRAGDLEKLRLRGLLREFAQYKESKKKLRQFRTEAVRAGFSHAWHERDYATIVEVAERLPAQVLQEDPELLMYYDNASLRVS